MHQVDVVKSSQYIALNWMTLSAVNTDRKSMQRVNSKRESQMLQSKDEQGLTGQSDLTIADLSLKAFI